MARVLLFCLDTIGASMAGPAIRYWEIAKALAPRHQVTLLTMKRVSGVVPCGFTLASLEEKKLRHAIAESDFLITQRVTHRMAWHAKRSGTRLILDAYDPMPLENLEVYKAHPMRERLSKHASVCDQFRFAFQMCDAVICANRRQRDLWMGLLLALDRISVEGYDRDPALDQLLAIVPFGLSSKPPQRTGGGLRQRHGIPNDAKLLVWGGGIWNWFDPITLIKAMHQLSLERSDCHLCFMGIKHPNEAIPEMEMAKKAVSLATELGLLGRYVHVHYGWTPYEERQNYLLDADIGVSTHFNHLETQYSFRTRILDYLWAGLPMITTEGDAFADLIEKRSLGLTVPFENSEALALAIATLADDSERRRFYSENIAQMRSEYYWENVTLPLEQIIDGLMAEKLPKVTSQIFSHLCSSLWKTRNPKRILEYAWAKVVRS